VHKVVYHHKRRNTISHPSPQAPRKHALTASQNINTTFFPNTLASKEINGKDVLIAAARCNPEPRTRDGEASNQLLNAEAEIEGM
jgi:hypothetical protein